MRPLLTLTTLNFESSLEFLDNVLFVSLAAYNGYLLDRYDLSTRIV
jgi:hypothetical protein